MTRLIVAYIIENDEDVFELSYNSIKDVADEIVLINGNHNKEYIDYIHSGDKIPIVLNIPYPHKHKGANGKQRNQYIEYIKEHFESDSWVLVLDADEVVDKPEKIKKTIELLERDGLDCADIHMRHNVYNLGLEDAMVKKHFVNCRLFKMTQDVCYDEVEHPILKGWKALGQVTDFCIWHLGYAREMFKLKKKYLNHMKKSNIHTPEFLEQWYHAHLLGEYPVSKVEPTDLPDIIKEHFMINEDYLYFRGRGVEHKHAEMVRQWDIFFSPSSMIDLGSGRGPFLRYWERCCKYCYGIELSQWAINNKFCNSKIKLGNINDKSIYEQVDLICAVDVLEHLNYKDLDMTLKNMYKYGKDFLFSIPFVGDPNLEADPTHIIKEKKIWWIKKLEEHGFEIEDTPEQFLYKKQIIIARK